MLDLKKPRISVIMPAYNAENVIARAIRSVQGQTVGNWELLVIDDCSTDGTVAVATAISQQDSRIKVYSNEENFGVAKSRNRGLILSSGEYIAFLDSDDQWHPEKLKTQLTCFQQTDADLVYTSYAIVDADGNGRCRDFIVPSEVSFADLLKKNVIGCSTVMLTEKIGRENRFQDDFYHEDYILWLKLLRSGCKAAGVTSVMVDYSYHKDSKAGNKGVAALERWKIYRRFLRLSPIKSAWYFAHYALAGVRKYQSL